MMMTDADRQRLAAILGMLGSEHAGERAAAGLQAEAFRRKHGLTWEKMLQPVVLNIPARQPEPPAPPPPRAPEPPAWVPPEPTQQATPSASWQATRQDVWVCIYGFIAVAALPIVGMILSNFR
jgi:hypothetical protein